MPVLSRPANNGPKPPEIAGQQIFHWHLELSSKCALKCPRCPRTERPGQYKVTEMSLNFIKKIFPPARLAHVRTILMSGGQGDAIYCSEFLKIIRHLKEAKPELQLVLTTNGSWKKEAWWREAAGIFNQNDIVMFSADGWDQESSQKYRVNSNFESMINGIKTLRRHNDQLYMIWSAILFRFNQDKMGRIQSLAKSLGFDAFNVVQSSLFGSMDPSYIDPDLGYDPLEPDKKFLGSPGNTDRGLYVDFKTHRSCSKNFWPLVLQLGEDYQREHKASYILPLCRIGERGLYVDAEGILYPCSWVSHPFSVRKSAAREKSISWEKSLWVEHKEQFDLKRRSLEEALSSPFWKKLSCSWQSAEKAFVECESKCLRSKSLLRVGRLKSKIFYKQDKFGATGDLIERYRRDVRSAAGSVLK